MSRFKAIRDAGPLQPGWGKHYSYEVSFWGYRLYAIMRESGAICDLCLALGNFNDITLFEQKMTSKLSYCHIITDKSYIKKKLQLNLFETVNVTLTMPHKRNMAPNPAWTPVFQFKRKRIETRFSQLVGQFDALRIQARKFQGFLNCVWSKITAMTIPQLLNVQQNNPKNHLKYALRY